jgi:hypothetical protein
MDRRTLLAALAALPSLAAAGPASAGDLSVSFAVMRNGGRIGTHSVQVTQAGERRTADIAIDIAVRFAFVTLYSYRHRAREVWDGDPFVSFDGTTDDNGDRHTVGVRLDGGAALIVADGARHRAPGSLTPDSWWRRASIEAGRWIDTQRGRIITARVQDMGPSPCDGLPAGMSADRYRLSGDVDLDVWYAGHLWVGLKLRGSDGSTIAYHPLMAIPARSAGGS